MPAKTPAPTKEEKKAPDNASSEMPIEKRVDELEELILLQGDAMEEIKNIFNSLQERDASGAQIPQAAVPEGLEEKLAAVGEIDKKISEINGVKSEIDQKIAGLDEMKQSVEKIASEMFLIKSKVSSIGAQDSGSKNAELEEMFEKHFAEIKERIESTKRSFSSIESRISAVEGSWKGVSNEMQNMRSSFEKIGKIENDVASLRNSQRNNDEMKSVVSNFKSLSDRVSSMEGALKGIESKIRGGSDEEKIKGIENKINSMHNALQQRVDNIQSSMQKQRPSQDVEQKISKLQEEMKNASFQSQEPISVLNIQMSDMLGKIIGVEMRVAMVEKNLEKFMKVQPVVLE